MHINPWEYNEAWGGAGSHPTDVRMTTRFKEGDLTEGLTGAIHETGHALYEQGRNLAYDGLPVNQVCMYAGRSCKYRHVMPDADSQDQTQTPDQPEAAGSGVLTD